MKQKIYHLLFPKSFRESIYNYNIRQYEAQEFKRLKTIEDAYPRSELSQVYIANLRLVTDRNALLNLMPKGSIVAEVGVDRGDFSRRILAITKPERLHLIDTWANDRKQENLKSTVENKYKAEIGSNRVILHQGEPLVELEKFDKGYFDWVYIDTDPSYENTIRELAVCQFKIKDGGIISGHKYATGDWLRKNRYGVIVAVHDFCKEHRWEIIYLTNESHRCLSYAIRKLNTEIADNKSTLNG